MHIDIPHVQDHLQWVWEGARWEDDQAELRIVSDVVFVWVVQVRSKLQGENKDD